MSFLVKVALASSPPCGCHVPQSNPLDAPPNRGYTPQRMTEQQHGLLVLDKPGGLSSAQCIARIKRLGQKKIGHAGTLDPMATGVLLVLLGAATKISGHLLTEGEKVYTATVRLGQTTDTWDKEGEVVAEAPWEGVSEAEVREGILGWQGALEQTVPPVSAAKHHGQPLYKLFRAGKDVPVKVKTIHISQVEVLMVSLPLVRFRVACSSGSYIRSLAHSLGIRLGCGAVLTELVREYSHPFDLGVAHSLESVLEHPELLPQKVVPITAALPHWPVIRLDAAQAARVRNGHATTCAATGQALPCEGQDGILLDAQDTPLALARAVLVQGELCWTIVRGLWL